MYGETYGIDMIADRGPLRWGHLKAGYPFFQRQLHLENGTVPTEVEHSVYGKIIGRF